MAGRIIGWFEHVFWAAARVIVRLTVPGRAAEKVVESMEGDHQLRRLPQPPTGIQASRARKRWVAPKVLGIVSIAGGGGASALIGLFALALFFPYEDRDGLVLIAEDTTTFFPIVLVIALALIVTGLSLVMKWRWAAKAVSVWSCGALIASVTCLVGVLLHDALLTSLLVNFDALFLMVGLLVACCSWAMVLAGVLSPVFIYQAERRRDPGQRARGRGQHRVSTATWRQGRR